ncbi:MAG: FAD-dependent oxidoreductase [Archaeoglobaceae archaeon]|uniref:FAD-binding oxidoreductase n=1 Tax=Archaeoglobus fulgidus TaxID=2234 RepID=A0A7J3M3L8_ARCFL
MNVAIIGAGIAGLATAYFLAKEGAKVKVFEQKFLLHGASGRNSGGLTAQFNDEELIKLALRSEKLYEKLQSEIGFNFLLRRNGYLKLFNSEEELREVNLQRKFGLKVEVLQAEEVKEIFPDINVKVFRFASYYPKGGVVFPWAVIWGLAKGCRDLGVEIYDFKKAEVVVENGKVRGVNTGEFHEADVVVNSAGAWSKEINEKLGIKDDRTIIREEICVTESIKPYLDPYILHVSSGLFLSQSMRGEIVGGIVGKQNGGINSSLDFLIRYAKLATNLVPKLKSLAVLRQWVGVYDEGIDGKPVVGFSNVQGFYQLNGFGRKGMSIALACAEKAAEEILNA